LQDIIRGDVKFETSLLDDKVLFKSDGMPTYHLANIVDDHLMETSHVIRGEEWLPSMPFTFYCRALVGMRLNLHIYH
jgi:glutamyl-tRNA synthetase